MRNFLLILSILITGCITHGPPLRPHQRLFYKAQNVGNLEVYIKHDVNDEERKLLIESVEIQSFIWEAWNSEEIAPARVYLFRGTCVPCGERKGRFGGAYFITDRDIHVAMGNRYEIASLYHELTHHRLNIEGSADVDHEDDLWKSVGKEQRMLRVLIRNKRKKLDFGKIYWSGVK